MQLNVNVNHYLIIKLISELLVDKDQEYFKVKYFFKI